MSSEEREDVLDAWQRFVSRFRRFERVLVLRGPLTPLIINKVCRGEKLYPVERFRAEQILPFLKGKNGKLADLRERLQTVLEA